jgi:elongation factor Ts
MATYTAQDVKRLREETDAPMMECKAALDEAGGEFEKAKSLLREKGKAAAAKRAGRSTAAGVVAVSASEDGKRVGAVVLESETDFVARNEDFVAIAQKLADIFRDNAPGDNPLAVSAGGQSVGEMVEAAVATIRENIQLRAAVQVTSSASIATYVHHDRTKGSIVQGDGTPDALRKVAIQVVSNPPEVVSKEQLPQEKIAQEIEIETQRAINEGKDEKIARNVATGRVNKEYIKRAVLLEQPFYADNSKSVGQYLKEEAGGADVTDFAYLAIGAGE